MGAIMELMDKFLKKQSIIELMDKFLNKLTIGPQAKEEDLGPCNLKRGGTDQPSKYRGCRIDLDIPKKWPRQPRKFNVEGKNHNKKGQ